MCIGLLVGVGAEAGGLYLTTYGTPDVARTSVGSNAMAADVSTAFHDPAGRTRLDDHTFVGSFATGFTRVQVDVDEARVGGGDARQQGGFVPDLASQNVHKISGRWRFGSSVNSVSGAALGAWVRISGQRTAVAASGIRAWIRSANSRVPRGERCAWSA